MSLEIIGWIGASLAALCALPQAWKSWRTGQANDISWLFLFMWLGGEIGMFIYVWPEKDWPLLTNYLLNIAAIYVIVRSKIL